jgi:hypothetical protein
MVGSYTQGSVHLFKGFHRLSKFPKQFKQQTLLLLDMAHSAKKKRKKERKKKKKARAHTRVAIYD